MIRQFARLRFLPLWLIVMVLGITSLALPVHADLPPRPTKTPVYTPAPPAGTLLLQTNPPQSGLWSVVQWQDVDGDWHDVEGWRGAVSQGQTIWWVEEGDWGKTPYRWLVFQNQGGSLLATSESFALPDSGQKLVVPVDIPSE